MLLQHLGNLKKTIKCHGMQVGNLQGNFVSIDADLLAGDWRGEIHKLGQSVTKVVIVYPWFTEATMLTVTASSMLAISMPYS